MAKVRMLSEDEALVSCEVSAGLLGWIARGYEKTLCREESETDEAFFGRIRREKARMEAVMAFEEEVNAKSAE